MALKQTRRAVSVSRASYESLRELAGALDVTMAQLVEQAIEALTTGKLAAVSRESAALAEMRCKTCGDLGHKANRCGHAEPLPEPAPQPTVHVTAATCAPPRSVEPIRLPAQLTEPALVQRSALRDGRRGRLKHEDTKVAVARIGLCAVCTKTAPVQRTQLDVGGPLYDICSDCNDGPIVERDHLFVGGSGIGDGNRRTKAHRTGAGR